MSINLEDIIELAGRRCEEADLYYHSGEDRSVDFENNKLKRVTSSQSAGVGLRVVSNGRIGFASTTDLRDPRRVVDMAVESAGFGEKAVFELPAGGADAGDVQTCDPAAGRIPMERMVDMGREALQMSRRANDDYLFNASIYTGQGVERVLNTRGLDAECESSSMSAGVGIEEVNDDGGLLDVYEHKSWGRPFESITDITKTVLGKMQLGAESAAGRAGRMPMVFTPKTIGTLLAPVMTALNGKLVHKGASRLAGQLGEKAFDERLTIYDDATIDWAPGSSPFDGEGLAAGRFALIEAGVVKNYLLDLQTAGLLGMHPTGNGYRSVSSRPSPGSANSLVAAGDTPYDDMVSGMKHGLIIDQTLGGGQSNTLAGEFSVNVALGFLVDNGRISGRVKDCMVAGNVYEVLSDIEAVGAERQWRGAACVPALCVGGLKLALDA